MILIYLLDFDVALLTGGVVMSADNWAYCPKCALEYQRTKENAERLPKLDQNLREDYFIGIRYGIFSVDFSAHCEECGFNFRYKWSQPAI